jgi:hypothetical protein
MRYHIMKLAGIILLLFPFLALSKGSETDTLLMRKETEINVILTNLRSAKDNKTRAVYNTELRKELSALLTNPDVLDYPFRQWATMSTIVSPDGEFRLFNWNVESDEGVHSHYCYLVKKNTSEANLVVELKEDKFTISPRPEETLTADHWYGALYYNIVPVKKGNKTLYTIFGYSGNDRSTNRKLLDVFYFKGKSLRIGYPLFQEAPGSQHLLRRVFFEYSEAAIMTVRMNENLGAIVFDHLVPENPQLDGIFDYYIPDMTYDGYKWENGIWVYYEDIIAYNTNNEVVRNYTITEDGDATTYRDTESNWIDPVDPDAPAGGGTSAIAPVENVNDKKKKNGEAKRNGKNRQHRITNRLKGPRSAVTGDRVKNKRN